MEKDIYILGVSGGFSPRSHNGAACILKNGQLIAAIEEERLVRIKHATGMLAKNAINYCLSQAGITMKEVDYAAFYLDSYNNLKSDLEAYFNFHFGHCPEIKLINHHTAHAACAYFTSGFEETKIITIDCSGDGVSTTLNYAKDGKITRLKQYNKPNSLGIFYAIITQWLGFDMDSDEYKVMGLSSYGKFDQALQDKMDKIIKILPGGYKFNDAVFIDASTRYQCKYNQELINILGENRRSNQPVTQREMDVAYAAQKQFERGCLELLKDLSGLADSRNLCLVGGSTLNCVMNSVLLHSGYADNVYVPSVAEDAGASMGAAMLVANNLGIKIEKPEIAYLGPRYSDEDIKNTLDMLKLDYNYLEEEALLDYVSSEITKGKIIGWFQGKLEFGARAW